MDYHDRYETFDSKPYNEYGTTCARVQYFGDAWRFMATFDDAIQIHDLDTGKLKRHIQTDQLMDAAVSPNGNLLLAALTDNRADVYDCKSGKKIGKTGKYKDSIDTVVWIDDEHFIAGPLVGKPGVHKVGEKEPTSRLKQFESEYSNLQFAVDRNRSIVYGVVDTSIIALDLKTGNSLWRKDFDMSPESPALSPDGKSLALVFIDGKLRIFDANTGQRKLKEQISEFSGVKWPKMAGDSVSWGSRLSFTPDGNTLAMNTATGTLVLFDMRSMTVQHRFERQKGMAWIEDMDWTEDGRLVIACSDNKACVWRMDPLERLITVHEED